MTQHELDVRVKLPPILADRLKVLRADPLPDKKAQAMRMKWARQAFILPPALKDRVGRLYMQHILSVDEETVLRFASNDPAADQVVGISQSGIVNPAPRSFWTGVQELEPQPLTDREIGYLRKNDANGFGATMMIDTWHQLCPNAPLLEKLAANAHVYK